MREPAFSEGNFRAHLAAGGAIQQCLVVAHRDDLRGSVEFIPFFRTSWEDGPLGLSLYRQRGLRGWSDFRKLLDFLRGAERGLRYGGPVLVVERSDPALAEWGIDLSGE